VSAATPILMPKLGLTMTEGLLASWNIKPGDEVRPGDVLFVVETEKIATEVEAQAEGRIESLEVEPGRTVPVGAVVATWTGPAVAAAGESENTPNSDKKSAGDEPQRPPSTGRIVATPLARRLARQRGIDLSRIRGSGPRGRIKAADVEAAPPFGGWQARSPTSVPVPLTDRAERRRPATQMEKIVARRLTTAKQTIPHFYVLAEADVTFLLRVREELNADGKAVRISVNHFVLAAVGRALAQMPEMNAVWQEEEVVTPAGPDVGIAVDTERGLMAPVLRDAGSLSLDTLSAAAATLVERARQGRLTPADLEGGAISVSNIGMHGASFLVPIVNPGQSAIVGVGAVKPVFRPTKAGAPELRQELGLVLSCDHRVFDGVRASLFLNRIIQFLQQPLSLFRP
jgi:pyruvate dehydrogenase E2 component (dihydrolipoamide acetyltransferase)